MLSLEQIELRVRIANQKLQAGDLDAALIGDKPVLQVDGLPQPAESEIKGILEVDEAHPT